MKWATKQVVEMQAELAKIGQCGDAAAPLQDKLAECEAEKADVESSLKVI